MNRITTAFARMQAQIEQRVKDGLTTPEGVERARKNLDMDLGEYARFQEIKSLAVLEGKLSEEEGQAVYACLGESLSVYNDQPAHVKSVLMQLFKVLLTQEITQKIKKRK